MKTKYGVFSVTKDGEIIVENEEISEGAIFNDLEDAKYLSEYLNENRYNTKKFKVFDVREHIDTIEESQIVVSEWLRNYVSNIFIYDVQFENIPFLTDAIDLCEEIDFHGLLEKES